MEESNHPPIDEYDFSQMSVVAKDSFILVIDDDDSIRLALEDILMDEGYKCKLCENTSQAQSYLKENTPDLILLDVGLPDGNGIEFCGYLRTRAETKTVPIIIVTGSGTKKSGDRLIQSLEAGASDYLEKPISIKPTLARIQHQLRLKMMQDQLLNQAKRLHKQYNEIQQLNEWKDRILSTAAHDLKNPLSNIKMYMDYLSLKDGVISASTHKRTIDIVGRSLNQMFQLVNDLVDLTQINRGKMALNMAEVDLKIFFHHVLLSHQFLANDKGIGLDFSFELECVSWKFDESRMNQVMTNLISNSIKFSHPRTNILLQVRSEEEFLSVEVVDQGQGILADEVDDLFKEFTKSSTRPTGDESSTGLGLSIVKNIIELHGGNVYLRSEWEKGTTVGFTLHKGTQ